MEVNIHDFVTDEITNSYSKLTAYDGEFYIYDSSFTCYSALTLAYLNTEISTDPFLFSTLWEISSSNSNYIELSESYFGKCGKAAEGGVFYLD